MKCPKCGSTNIQVQTFQEQQESNEKTKFHFKVTEKRHGLFWWLFIGWWWWMVELLLWICCTAVSKTRNKIGYATLFTCMDCGKQWKNMQ